jgi:hypothetical protein
MSRFNTLPCVGTVASGSRELLVIGTAHTPCRSSAEVSALIAQSRPDVVIIELDQERLECLLRTDEQGNGEQLRYGADFAAAVRGAAELGVPIVLGDAKARDLVARLRAAGAVADGERLWRAVQLALKGGRITDGVRASYVNVASSLRDDPAKMLPLLAGVWWTVLLTGLSGLATAPALPVGADEAAAGQDAPKHGLERRGAVAALIGLGDGHRGLAVGGGLRLGQPTIGRQDPRGR